MRSVFRHPDVRWGALLLAAGVALWLPRLDGPIDLRADAAVYYLLGTSLAEGRGYRLASEPGDIEVNQYPPLLPAFVAAHRLLAGTSDPDVLGVWLRRSYFVIFQLTLLAVYALARGHLAPPTAFLVALLGLSFHLTIFLSDILYSEVPFTLLTAAFFLFDQRGRGWWGFLGSAVTGVAAFLLRTAAVALLAAWVADALLRRRWGLAVLRLAVALAPFLAWQAHVRGVETGPEYRQPAYPYQRAPYQYSNVSYAENLKLIDPFAPEKGRTSAGVLVRRVLGNAALLPIRVGSLFTGELESWHGRLEPTSPLDRTGVALWWYAVSGAVGLLVLAGVVRLLLAGEWLMPLYVAGALGLFCLIPWSEQFVRYAVPVLPFLLLAYLRLLAAVRSRLAAGRGAGWHRLVWGLGVLSLVTGALTTLGYGSHVFWGRAADGLAYRGPGAAGTQRLFTYGVRWREFDMALHWLKENARPDEVVATFHPHWLYLRTGLKGVMFPYEINRAEAQRLLDAVPVAYVIVDDLGYPGVTRRYLEPVIRAHPEHWELVFSVPRAAEGPRGVEERLTEPTRVYRRVAPRP